MDIVRFLRIGLGLDFDGKGFGKAEEAIKSVQGLATKLVGTIAGGALLRGFVHMINETTEMADQTKRLSETVGIAADQFQVLAYAAKFSDVSQEELAASLSRVSNEAQQAASGNQEAAEKFHKLGLRVRDSAGNLRPVGEMFVDIANKIASVKNPTQQTAMAVQIFGRSGAKMIPFLKDGASGLQKYRDELESMGALMSDDFLKDSEAYKDEIDRLNFAWRGLWVTISRAVLPAFKFTIETMRRFTTGIREALKGTRFVEASLVTLGAALTYAGARAIFFGNQWLLAWAKAALPVLAVAAGITALALLVDDLWTYFEGGDSVIGDVIDTLEGFAYGAEEGEAAWLTAIRFIVATLIDMGSAFVGLVKNLVYIFANFGEFMEWIGSMIREWLVEPFKTAYELVKNGAIDLAAAIYTALIDPFNAFIDGIGTRVTRAWSAIKGVLPGFEVDVLAPVGEAAGVTPPRQLGTGGDLTTPVGPRPQLSAPSPQLWNVPGRAVGTTVNNTSRVEVQASVSGVSDPQAAAEAIGEQVEAVLQRHFDDSFAAGAPESE